MLDRAPAPNDLSAFWMHFTANHAYGKGVRIRTTGDIIAMSPPLIISKAETDQRIGTLGEALRALD